MVTAPGGESGAAGEQAEESGSIGSAHGPSSLTVSDDIVFLQHRLQRPVGRYQDLAGALAALGVGQRGLDVFDWVDLLDGR